MIIESMRPPRQFKSVWSSARFCIWRAFRNFYFRKKSEQDVLLKIGFEPETNRAVGIAGDSFGTWLFSAFHANCRRSTHRGDVCRAGFDKNPDPSSGRKFLGSVEKSILPWILGFYVRIAHGFGDAVQLRLSPNRRCRTDFDRHLLEKKEA